MSERHLNTQINRVNSITELNKPAIEGSFTSRAEGEESFAFTPKEERELQARTRRYFEKIKAQNRKKLAAEKKRKRSQILSKFIFHVVSNLFNVIAVIIYILITLVDNEKDKLHYNPEMTETLNQVEIGLTLYFLVEFSWSLFKSNRSFIRQILSFDSIIDIITIFPALITYYNSSFAIEVNFIRIFRIFRVFRVLRLYKSLRTMQFESLDTLDPEILESDQNSMSPAKIQFFTILVVITCFIFIGAGVFLGMQDLIPNSFSLDGMNFFDSMYFLVITGTTLGYGDIIPTNIVSRLTLICLIFLFVVTISTQVTKLVNLLRVWGNDIPHFNLENHYVVICDSTVSSLTVIYLLKNYDPKAEIVLVTDKKHFPISDAPPFENTHHIRTESLDSHVLSCASTRQSQAVFLFASKNNTNFHFCEKTLEYLIFKIYQYHNDIFVPVNMLSLRTAKSVLNNQKKKSAKQYTYTKILPGQKIKSMLMAKSLINDGYLAFMQNLIYNERDRKFSLKNGKLIDFYEFGCTNQIVVCPLSEYFTERYFEEAVFQIYHKSIKDHFLTVITSDDKHKAPVILIGLIISEAKKPIIFPKDRLIPKNAKGIFITNSQSSAFAVVNSFKKIFALPETIKQNLTFGRSSSMKRRQSNFVFNSQNRKKAHRSSIVTKYTLDELISKSFKFEDEIDFSIQDKPTEVKGKRFSMLNAKYDNVTEENIAFLRNFENRGKGSPSEILDKIAAANYAQKETSYMPEMSTPVVDNRIKEAEKLDPKTFKDHVLIVGYRDGVDSLFRHIATHFPISPSCVISNSASEVKMQKMLRQFRSLVFIKGDPLHPKHLVRAGIQKCKAVIFLTESNDLRTGEDLTKVTCYRSVDYFFNCKMSCELSSLTGLKLLGYVPLNKENKVEDRENLYPKFMKGEVLLEENVDGLLIKSFLDPEEFDSWLTLLSLGYDHTEKTFKNGKIEIKFPVTVSYPIGKEYTNREYCEFVSDLLSGDITAVPLGIFVEEPEEYEARYDGEIKRDSTKNMNSSFNIWTSAKKKIRNPNEMGYKSKKYKKNIEMLKKITSKDKVVLDYVDGEFPYLPCFITNPPPNFIIRGKCKALVLFHHVREVGYSKVMSRKSNLRRVTQQKSNLYGKMIKSQNFFFKVQASITDKYMEEHTKLTHRIAE